MKDPESKQYAEKIMMVDVDQITPMHFHWHKTEDIINRGGGKLVIQLYNSTPGETLDDTPVTVSTDGVQRTLKAGDRVVLSPNMGSSSATSSSTLGMSPQFALSDLVSTNFSIVSPFTRLMI